MRLAATLLSFAFLVSPASAQDGADQARQEAAVVMDSTDAALKAEFMHFIRR